MKFALVIGSLLAAAVLGRGVLTHPTGGLPFYRNSDRTPEWISPWSPVYSRIHRVGEFDLIDQSGHHITRDSMAGKIYVASFFFTGCRQLCPRLQSNLRQVQQQFAASPEVLILSHTVSAGDDTATLRRYAAINGVRADRWHLLTGDSAQISRLARQDYFAQLPDSISGVPTPLLHSETLVLVDRAGRVRGLYDGSLQYETDRLMDDLTQLLREPVRP